MQSIQRVPRIYRSRVTGTIWNVGKEILVLHRAHHSEDSVNTCRLARELLLMMWKKDVYGCQYCMIPPPPLTRMAVLIATDKFINIVESLLERTRQKS